ncbi:mechanosensitive ion channel family protein [Wolinella succinogenes]|uniref:mechanosensitive ion channel family protein n=1 Tax=Wolinella succinogenes TaxID=844 RepID=UPI002353E00D|nr:mechanosensitive ion channel domain-containing protein [Wolinella succinogenes]
MPEMSYWMKLFTGWSQSLLDSLFTFSPKLLAAILIAILGLYLAKLARRYTFRLLLKVTKDEILSRFLARVLYAGVVVLTLITALSNLGVQTASIIAVLGTAGLAIALSLKDSLSNLASGIMLIVFRHFTKGDTVELNGTLGNVEEISLFHTKLTTPDNRSVILPNASIAQAKIINFTSNPTRRLEWTFSVSYESDIRRAKEVILLALQSESRLLEEPAPLVGVGALGASGVDFIVRAWVKKEEFFAVQIAVNEAIKLALDEAAIEIPYNKLDVNLISKGTL